jgi:hypothetical protein
MGGWDPKKAWEESVRELSRSAEEVRALQNQRTAQEQYQEWVMHRQQMMAAVSTQSLGRWGGEMGVTGTIRARQWGPSQPLSAAAQGEMGVPGPAKVERCRLVECQEDRVPGRWYCPRHCEALQSWLDGKH